MKKLLLSLSILGFGLGTVSANVHGKKSVFKIETAGVKCYKKIVDAYGNVYYVEVKCPRVII